MNKNNPPPISVCVAALAAVGFAAGFFGPIALNPTANQGPLLGIFITGPGGVILGLIVGVLLKWLPLRNELKWYALIATCVVGGIATLYFCLPEPKIRGYAIDGKIIACVAPNTRIDAAVKYWEDRIAAVTWQKPRAGWKEGVERLLRDEGIVIEVEAARQRQVLEQRKPWNYGRLNVSGWRTHRETRTYFARFAGSSCTDYPQDGALLYVAAEQGSKEWPPADLQNFLDLALIEPLPNEYRALVGE